MKNILVYDIAAENGGAVSILEYYYKVHKEDKENRYYYLLSVYQMDSCDNIIVINAPEIKKSWLHRIVFDYIKTPKLLKRYKIDEVISLQNTVLPTYKGKQTVYMHNILPFTEYRYSLREDKLMWVYQNIIGRVIMRSIKKADRVIVQAAWIREAIEKKMPGSRDKISVMFPDVFVPGQYKYRKQRNCMFFYPANNAPFKNHKLIIEAATLLAAQGRKDFEILFTLQGNESVNTSTLKIISEQKHLPIRWIGRLTRTEVFEKYTESVLLFPSYIETVGLPLYEAKQIGSPILVAECEYAKEVLHNYNQVTFFDWRSANDLAFKMTKILESFDNEKNG